MKIYKKKKKKQIIVQNFDKVIKQSGVFCTNNAQASSLFSNVTLTSRRTE